MNDIILSSRLHEMQGTPPRVCRGHTPSIRLPAQWKKPNPHEHLLWPRHWVEHHGNFLDDTHHSPRRGTRVLKMNPTILNREGCLEST